MTNKKNEITENKETKFSKEQIVLSKKYVNDVDIVNALLEDDKQYSFKEVDSIIAKFKKKKEEVK